MTALDRFKGKNMIMFNHIKRVMVKYSYLDSNNFINKLKDVYNNAYEYCTHSGDKLYTSIGEILTSSAYINEYYSYVTSNTITDRYKRDSLTTSLQICLGICVLTNIRVQHIIKSLPPHLDHNIPYSVNTVHALYDCIESSDGDVELCEKIGTNCYGVIKYLISLNNLNISSINDTLTQSTDVLTVKSEKPYIFAIDYPYSISKEFNVHKPEFLFHGSSFSNWFEIIRNGIKNLSGTPLMTHGQVYGPGVYTTDSCATALSYSNDKSGFRATAVIQVLGGANTYKKASGIYVVPDGSKILIRYLVVSGGKFPSEKMINFFTQTRISEITNTVVSMNALSSKRISRDTIKLSKKLVKIGFDIKVVDSRVMISFGGLYKFRLEFPVIYPLESPALFIESPIIKNCYQIMNARQIIIPQFTKYRWSSNIKVHKIVSSAMDNIIKNYVTNDGEYETNNTPENVYTEFIRSVIYVS
jgi:ubiquitin-protein ligase